MLIANGIYTYNFVGVLDLFWGRKNVCLGVNRNLGCIYWSFSLKLPPFSSLFLYSLCSPFLVSLLPFSCLSLILSLIFSLELKCTESASVWLMLWEALYQYLYVIQCEKQGTLHKVNKSKTPKRTFNQQIIRRFASYIPPRAWLRT